MPAFSFEKIAPPAHHGAVSAPAASAASSAEKKPRGVIVQILGRFVDARVERNARVEEDIVARREQRPAKD